MAKNPSIPLNTTALHASDQTIRLDGIHLRATQVAGYTTDAEWIEACKRGERLAQRWLYEKFAGKMYYVCFRYLGNTDDAQDTLHDAFVKVFASITRFRGDASLETWLTRIMANTSINSIRKQARRGIKKDIDDCKIADESDATAMIDVPTGLSAQDVLQMITELPIGYRTVLSMYALDAYSHRDIAKALGISEGTSKSQLAKARKMLKQRIDERNGKE
jgi:RNA polymerase sigma-70 factor (ECF subfamily)